MVRPIIAILLVVVLLTSSLITGCAYLFDDTARQHYRQGNELFEQGRLDEAMDEYTEAIRLNPKHAQAYLGQAVAYGRLGKKAEAIAEFEKCITLTDNPQWIEMARQQIEELSK